MGALMRAHDWAATALGAPEGWPQPLKTTLRILLNTQHPMYLFWGAEAWYFYNDAYRPSIGPERHPASLGRPGREVWAEIWDVIGPQFDQVMRGGGATWHENQLVPITRHGRREDVYWTYSYSPIDAPDAPCGVGGVLVVCTETTRDVHSARHQAFRLALSQTLHGLSEAQAMMEAATRLLGEHLGVAQVGFGEIDAAQQHVTVRRDWNDGRIPSVVGAWRMDDFGPAFIRDMKAGRTISIPDIAQDARTNAPDAIEAYGTIRTRALLDVPLVRDGRMVAMLFIHHPEPRPWTAEESALVEETCGRLWAAVERARAEAKQASQRRILEMVASGAPLPDVLETLIRFIESQQPRVRCAVLLLGDDGQRIEAVHGPSLPEAFTAGLAGLPIAPPYLGSCGEAMHRCSPVIVPDVARERRYPPAWREALLAQDLRAVRSTPIPGRNGRALGCFAMHHAQADTADAADPELVDIAIHLAAIALEHDRASRALLDSETRLRLFVEEAPAAIAMFDRQMRYLAASRRYRDDYRLGDMALTGRSHYDIFPELPERWKDVHRRCLDGATEGSGGEAFVRADGHTDWLRWEIRPWRTSQGDVGGIVLFSEDIAARVRSDAKLREAEERFRALVDAAAQIVWTTDAQGSVQEDSPSWRAFTGQTYEEWQDFGWLDALHPDDAERAGTHWRHCAANKLPYEIEYRLRHCAGGHRWTLARGVPLLDEDGAVRMWVGMNTDIEERKRAEAALRESETRFRRTADTAPALLWVTDAGNRCTYLSRSWFETTGQTPEEAEGSGWLDATHPEDRARSSAIFLAAAERREPFHLEYRLRQADGTYRWAIDAGRPHFSEDGAYLGYVGSVIDIHERKVAEALVREQLQRNRAITDNAAVALFIMDEHQHCVFMNPAAEQLTGYCLAEVQGRPLHDVVHHTRPDGSHFPLEECAIDRAFPERAQMQGEEVFVHKDGSFYPVAFTASPIQDEETGKPVGTIIEVRGIRAEKEAQAELHRHRAELERLVEERTAELLRASEERRRAEKALHQGEKLAAIGQLTGGIAHDFNNMLQVVASGVTLLRMPTLSPERKATLMDGIAQAAENAKNLTGQLLSFARQQALKPETFDLNARLDRMVELLRHSLGARIRVETVLAGNLWPVTLDPSPLETALLNLGVNARDAMPEGGTLHIETRNIHRDGPDSVGTGYVCLTLRDTGEGMTPEVRARIFEPFFTTKPLGKGTGLGLAQVHGFIKQSGGEIEIDTAPGEGTAVHLLLPRAAAGAVIMPPEGAAGEPARDHRAAGQTVLVVDDNADVASFVATLLGEMGYATRRARSATEALTVLGRGERVDAVFSDIVMPGDLDGIGLARAIRRDHPGVAVVLATGYSERLTKVSTPLGVEVLSKPYRADDLVAALGRAFADAAASGGEPRAADD